MNPLACFNWFAAQAAREPAAASPSATSAGPPPGPSAAPAGRLAPAEQLRLKPIHTLQADTWTVRQEQLDQDSAEELQRQGAAVPKLGSFRMKEAPVAAITVGSIVGNLFRRQQAAGARAGQEEQRVQMEQKKVVKQQVETEQQKVVVQQQSQVQNQEVNVEQRRVVEQQQQHEMEQQQVQVVQQRGVEQQRGGEPWRHIDIREIQRQREIEIKRETLK